MNYKRVWGVAGIALAGAATIGASAQAADLGRDHGYKDEPAYTAPTTWAGPYFGGHLGAAWANGSANLHDADTHTLIEEDNSLIGGVHFGFNGQSGAFVYGLEGDVSFADHIDYLGSLRGRLGVAAGNWLFYGTGGVAFLGANFSGPITLNDVTTHFDASEDQVGFVVGGGTEVKLSPNWSVGVEGLYYGFDGTTTNTALDAAEGYELTTNTATDIGVVRGRVSYHFGHSYEPLK